MRGVIAAVVALGIVATAGGQEVYRCERDGTVIFSEVPCGADSQRLRLAPLPAVSEPPSETRETPRLRSSASRPTAAATRESAAAVRVVQWKERTVEFVGRRSYDPSGKNFVIEGEVANEGAARAYQVSVKVEGLAFFGDLLAVRSGPAEPYEVPAGGKAKFRVELPWHRDIRKFTVTPEWK